MRNLWNRPDVAVWSLVTSSKEGIPNMNICSYVSAISLDPKLMMVAVYHNTKTHDNITIGGVVLLQLLSETLAPVVRTCGQKSGKQTDKIHMLQKRYTLAHEQELPYFTQAAGFALLQVEQCIKNSGDHDLLIGRVVKSKNLNDTSILTTTYLKHKGYIR